MIELTCPRCNSVFQKQKKEFNYCRKRNPDFVFYCSSNCRHDIQVSPCSFCGKEVRATKSRRYGSKTGNIYCSKSCAVSKNNSLIRFGENHWNYLNGASRYRKLALEKYGAVCSNERCALKGVVDIPIKMLDVDHIDCDRSNNSIENLQVLCVWCHALKTRKVFGALP